MIYYLRFAYLDYLIYYSDEDEKYNEEDLKIINDCETIITIFLHKNYLLSKDFSIEDITDLTIYVNRHEISYKKVFKKFKLKNKFDLVKEVIDVFKK